jgi:hypothetical protein
MFSRKVPLVIVYLILFALLLVGHYMDVTHATSVQNVDEPASRAAVKAAGAVVIYPDSATQLSSITPLTEIMQQDFEGSWPPPGWQVVDNSNSDGGEYFWGKRNCHPHTGGFGGWSVGGGAQGSALPCDAYYPNHVFSWATYGPFDLSEADSSILTFHFWGRTEGGSGCPYDYFFVGSSLDGTQFSGTKYCGDWTNGSAGNGYYADSLDLSGRLGQSQVWIAFVLFSDVSIVDMGMTIDNISLDVESPATITPTFTSSPTNTPTNTPVPPDTATPTNTTTHTPAPSHTPTETLTPTDIPVTTQLKYYLPAFASLPTPTSGPPPTLTSTPTSTPSSTPTNTPTNTPTSTPTNTPTNTPPPLPPDSNIPCLLVLAQKLSIPGGFEIQAYCVSGSVIEVQWRYDPVTGAISGFDLTIRDNQDNIIYEASIDIERDQFGRVDSYSGTVSGVDFSSFTESIVNEYDALGKVIGADVTKVYTGSGDTYTMDLTPCPLGDSWSGYQVNIWGGPYDGDLFVMGECD